MVLSGEPGSRLLITAPVLLFGLLLLLWQFFEPTLVAGRANGVEGDGSAILMVFYLFLTEGRQKKAISGMFSTMVSPEVLKHIQEESGSLKLPANAGGNHVFPGRRRIHDDL